MSERDFEMKRLHLLSEFTEVRRFLAETPEDEVLVRGSWLGRTSVVERRLARLEAEIAAAPGEPMPSDTRHEPPAGCR